MIKKLPWTRSLYTDCAKTCKRKTIQILRIIKYKLKCPALPVEFFFLKKKLILNVFSLYYRRDTPGFLQKISAHSVKPFGQHIGIIYTNVLFYYIDFLLCFKLLENLIFVAFFMCQIFCLFSHFFLPLNLIS